MWLAISLVNAKIQIMYMEAIKIFCDVVRQRSFSRAAEINHISQSAVSQNVLQLERGLGVRLLDRSKRPFKLTAEGQIYYDGCRAIVDQYAVVEAQVRAAHKEVAGTVRVSAIYSVGLAGMSTYVEQFSRLYPQTRLRLAYLHPDRVVESVATEEADLGILSYPRTQRDLIAVPWCEEPMVVVCPVRHPLAECKLASGADLDGIRFVAFAEGLTIRREIERQLRKHRCEPQVVMAFDNIETIKRAVEIGEGVTILPAPTVQAEVKSGSLIAIPLHEPSMVRPLGVIHRRRTLTATEQAFIRLLRGQHASDHAGENTHEHDAVEGAGKDWPSHVSAVV